MDDTDPKLIWRGIGRGLDRCFPPDRDADAEIEQLLDALRKRDSEGQRASRTRAKPAAPG